MRVLTCCVGYESGGLDWSGPPGLPEFATPRTLWRSVSEKVVGRRSQVRGFESCRGHYHSTITQPSPSRSYQPAVTQLSRGYRL
jgi:hypothetical protein